MMFALQFAESSNPDLETLLSMSLTMSGIKMAGETARAIAMSLNMQLTRMPRLAPQLSMSTMMSTNLEGVAVAAAACALIVSSFEADGCGMYGTDIAHQLLLQGPQMSCKHAIIC
jgi:hypothetical protein